MTMLPKKTQVDSGLQAGALVVYENDGRPLVAAILSFKNQKYQVLNQRGREAELPAARMHLLPGKLPAQATTTQEKANYLEGLVAQATSAAEKLDLGEIWSFVASEEKDYSTEELSTLYHGNNEIVAHLALHLALLGDRIFFKRKDAGFSPRPAEIVDDLKKSEQSRVERQRIQDLLLSTIKERIRNPKAPIPDELQPTLHLLFEVAAAVPELDNNRLKDAKDLVDLCAEKLSLVLQGNRDVRAFQLLEAAHLAGPNTNLAFVRNRYALNYPSDVVTEAAALKVPSRIEDFPSDEQSKRQDLTALECFTIDDISTRDMDDAVSIERTRDGYRLGIHISDVASIVPLGSALDRDALARATSIYAPERAVNMFPPELAENKLSLVQGEVRAALSCMIEVDRSYHITGSTVVPSLIKVTQRYTYDDVDLLLENPNSELNSVYNIASVLEAHRISEGALKMGKREIQIVLDENGDFRMIEIDENSTSRSLVGELMVLANTIFAQFGVDHGLPLIFRGQEGPDGDLADLPVVPEGPAADYLVRSKLKKSFTSVRPVRHSSLALDAYIQATSPIRRYADIVNQRQILEMIFRGKAFYSAQECAALIEKLESPLGLANMITKETRRFWLLRALEKLSEKTTRFHGTVLRTDLKNPLVELHELVMPVLVKMHRPVKPGDEIEIDLIKVDARSDYLRLEMARQ
ncbi:MAG: RNB domain-containing ribonuclease [Deltaproteobacteria bacterium]|nr:RNB domain-containing ribonuclease [Deltaproteobacteria bacterium]